MRRSVLLAALLVVPGAAQARRLRPIDEGPRDPSFHAFRRRLMAALARHDRRFVLSILAPAMQTDFGGGHGAAAFRRHWRLDRPNSPLWHELGALLRLGGSFQDGAFWAPYVYTRFPDDLDSFTYGCILGREVPVRRSPSPSAPIVARLSNDLVKLPDPGEKARWVHVVAPSGRSGYVPRASVRRPIDYRASFRKLHGRWQLTALVAGD